MLGPQALFCLGQLSSCLPGLGWSAPEWATHPGWDGEHLNGQPPFVETKTALKALILGAQDIRGGGCVSWLLIFLGHMPTVGQRPGDEVSHWNPVAEKAGHMGDSHGEGRFLKEPERVC